MLLIKKTLLINNFQIFHLVLCAALEIVPGNHALQYNDLILHGLITLTLHRGLMLCAMFIIMQVLHLHKFVKHILKSWKSF